MWVFLILCFLVCGCGGQGEQSGKSIVSEIHGILAFVRPSDWKGDRIHDGVCIYVFFHDREENLLLLIDLTCTVDFRFYERIIEAEKRWVSKKGKFIYRIYAWQLPVPEGLTSLSSTIKDENSKVTLTSPSVMLPLLILFFLLLNSATYLSLYFFCDLWFTDWDPLFF